MLPQNHAYMEVFNKYQDQFGGANRVLISVVSETGDIFNAEFLDTLKKVTEAVFFLPGINKSTVQSLFTPNVRYIEIVEDGLIAGQVVPANYRGSDAEVQQVKNNTLKAGITGRLVANDFSAAIVIADLIEIDPKTHEKLDYLAVANLLETEIRDKFSNGNNTVHIIGFTKAIGDIADAAKEVLAFLGVAITLTAVLVYLFTYSARYTALLLACSVLSVIWTLGLLVIEGSGIDPISILVPFLVFAIGVSHGVQVVNATGIEVQGGADPLQAAKTAFRRLIVPGVVALASDCAGFLSIMLIEVEIIRDLATTASLGMGAILCTNLFLMPVLVSYITQGERYKQKAQIAAGRKKVIWKYLARIATMPIAVVYLFMAFSLAVGAYFISQKLIVGDRQHGVSELREDARYNLDAKLISEKFNIGLDSLIVIIETKSYGCIDFDIVDRVDDFSIHVAQIPGVSGVLSLPIVARNINVGMNEGNPKWNMLPRTTETLTQSANLGSSSGLTNLDCSVMPVMIYPEDHYAETIDRIIEEVNQYSSKYDSEELRFQLALGNIGVMATSNDLIRKTKVQMMVWVYIVVTLLCVLAFRSFRCALCVALPLTVVTSLTFALMVVFDIGLKISTLPMMALGVGIGVDYGIYIFTWVKRALENGSNLVDAFEHALGVTGNAVMVTGLTLACGVFTWIFSDLQFQVDMGILLTFMFLANMLGAMITLPAIARLLFGSCR